MTKRPPHLKIKCSHCEAERWYAYNRKLLEVGHRCKNCGNPLVDDIFHQYGTGPIVPPVRGSASNSVIVDDI